MNQLTLVEESLLLAAFYRGNLLDDSFNRACCDQVITLSLFYTGDISNQDCIERFKKRSYVMLFWKDGNENNGLETTLSGRYSKLIELIDQHPDLIEGFGNLHSPANPCYTACRLTQTGIGVAKASFNRFEVKPDFPNWPDRRSMLSE